MKYVLCVLSSIVRVDYHQDLYDTMVKHIRSSLFEIINGVDVIVDGIDNSSLNTVYDPFNGCIELEYLDGTHSSNIIELDVRDINRLKLLNPDYDENNHYITLHYNDGEGLFGAYTIKHNVTIKKVHTP